jgi:hypothetical protein
LQCSVATGLGTPGGRPSHACSNLSYVGSRVALAGSGRARFVACADSAGPFADPESTVYLRYGRGWSDGGLACSESLAGLTCRNSDRHGFFISLSRWFTF